MSMWTDNRLTWDPAKFGDQDRIRIAATEVHNVGSNFTQVTVNL